MTLHFPKEAFRGRRQRIAHQVDKGTVRFISFYRLQCHKPGFGEGKSGIICILTLIFEINFKLNIDFFIKTFEKNLECFYYSSNKFDMQM